MGLIDQRPVAGHVADVHAEEAIGDRTGAVPSEERRAQGGGQPLPSGELDDVGGRRGADGWTVRREVPSQPAQRRRPAGRVGHLTIMPVVPSPPKTGGVGRRGPGGGQAVLAAGPGPLGDAAVEQGDGR